MRDINWAAVVTWMLMLGVGYFTLKALIFMLKAIL